MRILVLALNDLLLTLKDRPVFFWMIIMPVGFVFIFGQMDRDNKTPPKVSLGVVDQDQSFLSLAFREALRREGFSIRETDSADPDSIAAIPRYVHVPAGFQDSIALGQQVTLPLTVRANADSEFSMTAEMHIQRAIIATLVNLIESDRRLSGAPDDQTPGALNAIQPLEIDTEFERVFAAVAAEPPRITMASENAGSGRPVPGGMRQSLPAMLTLFMLVNTGIYGAVILTQEKQDRVLARLATFPLSRPAILTGKLLGRTCLALMQAAILLLAGRYLLHAYIGSSLLGLSLLVICLAVAVGAIALFWGAVLRRGEQATAVTMVVSLFLGAIGGCWWPLEVVPAWMRTAGHISPAAWAMDGFHALISFGAGVEGVLIPCLVLLAYAAVFGLIGARLLRFTD